MRTILVVCPSTAGRADAANLAAIQAGELAQVALAPDLRFDFRAARVAPNQWDTHAELLLADIAIFEAGLDAERQGYDAVCVESVSDAAVAALRSQLDIPVLGPGRVCYHVALMLGNRFSILTAFEGWRLLYERRLIEYGLENRCTSIRALGMEHGDIHYENLFGGREERYLDELVELGRRCVDEDGADVVVIGSTTMYQLAPKVAASLPVPVVNPAATVFKLAEALLDLGLTHSRRAYRRPVSSRDDLVHAMLDAVAETG